MNLTYNHNTLIALRQYERDQHNRQKRIRNLSNLPTPRQDNQLQRYRHMVNYNPKRRMMLETKYTEVERQNRILLEKITNIMQKRKWSSRRRGLGTLNEPSRRKQIEKITYENNKIYNRIKNQKSCYSMQEYEEEFNRTRHNHHPSLAVRILSKGKIKSHS